MNEELIKNKVTLESIAESISNLVTKDDLRAELKNFVTKDDFKELESQIDSLARMTKHEFDKIHIKLDEMDQHLVILDGKTTGLQNQLDNIYLNYPARNFCK